MLVDNRYANFSGLPKKFDSKTVHTPAFKGDIKSDSFVKTQGNVSFGGFFGDLWAKHYNKERYVESLKVKIQDGTVKERLKAAVELGELKVEDPYLADRIVDLLMRPLWKDEDPGVREVAAEALEKRNVPERCTSLFISAAAEGNKAARKALIKMDNLKDILLSDLHGTNENLALSAAIVLRTLPTYDKDSIARSSSCRLAALLVESKSPRIVREAAWALAQSPELSDLEVLKFSRELDFDPDVRAEIESALKVAEKGCLDFMLKGNKVEEICVFLLKKAITPEVRIKSAEILGIRVLTAAAKEALQYASENDPDSAIKKMASDTLKKMKERAKMEKEDKDSDGSSDPVDDMYERHHRYRIYGDM